jgi:hypothetical protein
VARHDVDPDDVDAVLEGRFAIFRNRRDGRGQYQLVGKDSQGRYLTVIVEPTSRDADRWRVVTAWQSKLSEISKARRLKV